MDETHLSKAVLRHLVQIAGVLIRQLLVRVDGMNPVNQPLQLVIPLPVIFHERIDPAGTRRTRGENKNVASDLPFSGVGVL